MKTPAVNEGLTNRRGCQDGLPSQPSLADRPCATTTTPASPIGGKKLQTTHRAKAQKAQKPPSDYPEILGIESADGAPERYGPGADIFGERVAVMMYDGGLREEEATHYWRSSRLGHRLGRPVQMKQFLDFQC
jgi:hypothetical protein